MLKERTEKKLLSYEIVSEKGERFVNEDAVGWVQNEDVWCFVLADGLGGHGGGEQASSLIVQVVLEYFKENGCLTEECLKTCFTMAQEKLMEKQEELKKTLEMKSTLVILLKDKKRALWGHVGDSRLYRFPKSKEVMHTLDHSVPQMLVALGEIEDKDIRGHEDRNRLLRVVGVEWETPRYQLSGITDLDERDAFLLCSDGFWEWVDEKQMLDTLQKANSTKMWIHEMEKIVIKNGTMDKTGKMDNYSAIGVMLKER